MPRVRRLVRWTIVTVGIAALVRWLRRRGDEPVADTAVDPADDLRRKLAESRAGESVTASESPATATVEERRAEVHEQGRATAAEMNPEEE